MRWAGPNHLGPGRLQPAMGHHQEVLGREGHNLVHILQRYTSVGRVELMASVELGSQLGTG